MSAKKTLPCPACREYGRDTVGDNLIVFPSGKFHCIAVGKDKEHNRRIIELMPELGSEKGRPSSGPVWAAKSVQRQHTTPTPKTQFGWPELEHGTASDFRQLARLRDVNMDGLRIMSDRGLLRFADFDDKRAWVALDPSGKNAQARLLSGEEWRGMHCMSRSPKSESGTIHGWPIGITAAETFCAIALVEGLPDFISVLHHASCHGLENKIAPVMMPGAGVSIIHDELPLFAGKRIRIFVHDDDPGKKAFRRWANQLQSVGAVLDGFAFNALMQTDGQPVKDLNDLCRIDADSWETHRDAIESIMDFAGEVVCPE